MEVVADVGPGLIGCLIKGVSVGESATGLVRFQFQEGKLFCKDSAVHCSSVVSVRAGSHQTWHSTFLHGGTSDNFLCGKNSAKDSARFSPVSSRQARPVETDMLCGGCQRFEAPKRPQLTHAGMVE